MIRPRIWKRFEFKEGRGFSLRELKSAGLSLAEAKRLDVAIDTMRRSKYDENIKTLAGIKKAAPPAPKKRAPKPVKKKVPAKKKVEKKAPVKKPAKKKAALKPKKPAKKEPAKKKVEKKAAPKKAAAKKPSTKKAPAKKAPAKPRKKAAASKSKKA